MFTRKHKSFLLTLLALLSLQCSPATLTSDVTASLSDDIPLFSESDVASVLTTNASAGGLSFAIDFDDPLFAEYMSEMALDPNDYLYVRTIGKTQTGASYFQPIS